MDAYQARLVETWGRDDAASIAHFKYYSLMLRHVSDAWVKEEARDMKRGERILEASDHLQKAGNRFMELMKDHAYWTERWGEPELREQKSKA